MAEQYDLFRKIWEERGPFSEVSKAWIPMFHPVYMSHLVTKGSREDLKLYPYNIVIMTYEEHRLWENHKDEIRHLPEWQWVFQRAERIKRIKNWKKD